MDGGDKLSGGVEEEDKKPAAISNLSPQSEDKFAGGAEEDKKPAAVSNPSHPSENAHFGDSNEEDVIDDLVHLALTPIGTVVNVDTTCASLTAARISGASIVDIPSLFLDANHRIAPRNTSKSLYEMSFFERSRI